MNRGIETAGAVAEHANESLLAQVDRKLSLVGDMASHLEDEIVKLADRALGEAPSQTDAEARDPGNRLTAIPPGGAVGDLFRRAESLRLTCERAIRALDRVRRVA